ncbi:MAG: hypothetical protein Q9205_006454 [Flavoplaca limonia]
MAPSALIGQPAANEEDYWIAKALLQSLGMVGADPWKGVPLPPQRPPPELYRFESRASSAATAYSVSMAFMIIITLTRLGLRIFSKRMRWGLDDTMMIFAFTLTVAWPSLGLANVVHGGVGKHMYDVTYHQYYVFKYIGSIQSIIFYPAVAFIKMSIIAFNMRLTGLTSRRWMIVHWTLFASMVVFAILAILMTCLFFDPPRARFDLVFAGKLDTPPRMTMDMAATGYGLVAIHVTSDVLLLSFFGIVLWKLQMSRIVKFRLLLVFAVGALSFAAAVKWQLAQKMLLVDPLWHLSNQIGWSLVDLTAGLTVASLPILSSLFVVAFNRIKGSLRSLTGASSRNEAARTSPSIKMATASTGTHRAWHGKSLLSNKAWSSNSDVAESISANEDSIYATTPGWEKPLGHVEEKEAWTTRAPIRNHQRVGCDRD